MQLVVIQFKRGLVNHCLSENVSEDLTLTQQEDLIQFYYNEYLDNQIVVGFSNVEDKAAPKDLYTYISKDIIEAMWGLCVKAYNELDRRHNDYFYMIDKTWVKIKRLIAKWDDLRKLILPKIKTEHQSDFGFQHLDLSDSASDPIKEYNENHYVKNEDMDTYLFSLFRPYELIDVVVNDDKVYPFEKKETSWQLPDFASDEVIFRKAKEELKKSRITSKNAETIEAEIIKNDEVKNSPLILFPVITEDSPTVKETELSPIGEEQVKDVVLLPEGDEQAEQPKPSPPQRTFYNQRPGQKAPPFSSFELPGRPPMGSFGYGYPGMPPNPYNPMGGPIRPMQGIPQDISQIDFESSDHPDPFSNYR
jgi:hypothetical protein